jgi:hypothetical protein
MKSARLIGYQATPSKTDLSFKSRRYRRRVTAHFHRERVDKINKKRVSFATVMEVPLLVYLQAVLFTNINKYQKSQDSVSFFTH